MFSSRLRKTIIQYLLFFLLLAHSYHSFRQYLTMPLDGDLASIVLPSANYEPVLEDPLALSVLRENRSYANPNRFFSHWSLSNYFKILPGFLQYFVEPIQSIYAAAAIAKTATQVALVAILALYISENPMPWSAEFLLSAAILCPFFMADESYRLEIIDPATTFVFFYAIPCGLLLLFLLPFFRRFLHGPPISRRPAFACSMLLLAFLATLSGPVIPGFTLSVCAVSSAALWWRCFARTPPGSALKRTALAFRGMPKDVLGYLILISALSLYSLHIGRNNSENLGARVPLLQRYLLLPKGVAYVFANMTLLPPLIGAITVNVTVIATVFKGREARKIVGLAGLAVGWSALYILLLPLGGYREYRPFILSGDVLTPVTLSMVLLFGLSVHYLICHLRPALRSLYIIALGMFLLMYLIRVRSTRGSNACEVAALKRLAGANEKIVRLSSDCTVMSWEPIRDYRESEVNAELLKYWGVTHQKRLYYQG